MRGGVSTGTGGGSRALGVDRRRRSGEHGGRGEGGFGQVAVARGTSGIGREWWERELRRGEAR